MTRIGDATGGARGATAEPAPATGRAAARGAALRRAAVEFEAYVLEVLLREMRRTVPEGGLFGDSHVRGYRALLEQGLARRAAEAGGLGLARQLLEREAAR